MPYPKLLMQALVYYSFRLNLLEQWKISVLQLWLFVKIKNTFFIVPYAKSWSAHCRLVMCWLRQNIHQLTMRMPFQPPETSESPNALPHTPGIGAAGRVIHSTSSEWKARDQVICTGYDLGKNTTGGFGQYIKVPANGLSENLIQWRCWKI